MSHNNRILILAIPNQLFNLLIKTIKNLFGSFDAFHFRHILIHYDQMYIISWELFIPFLEFLESLSAVLDVAVGKQVIRDSDFGEDVLESDEVGPVVVCD